MDQPQNITKHRLHGQTLTSPPFYRWSWIRPLPFNVFSAFIFCIVNVSLYFQSVMLPVPSYYYCGIYATVLVRCFIRMIQIT